MNILIFYTGYGALIFGIFLSIFVGYSAKLAKINKTEDITQYTF